MGVIRRDRDRQFLPRPRFRGFRAWPLQEIIADGGWPKFPFISVCYDVTFQNFINISVSGNKKNGDYVVEIIDPNLRALRNGIRAKLESYEYCSSCDGMCCFHPPRCFPKC